MSPTWRSLLFVPADAGARVEKAATGDADAVILDLEDGVAPDRKAAARLTLADAVGRMRGAGKPVVVRINAGWREACLDLAAAMLPGVVAIMAPKVEGVARLVALDSMIAEWEAERSLSPVGVIALVESASGLAHAAALASVPRVSALALGPEDFALDCGVPPTPALLDLPCRQLALAAQAAGVAAFATPISIAAFRDEAGIAAANVAARALGIVGALCIHPVQVMLANRHFAPTTAEIEQARTIHQAWIDAGGSGVVAIGGRMIDAPVAARAARLLATWAGVPVEA